VTVLEDVGEIVLESGNSILLQKDSTISLKFTDAEKLIQQGLVIMNSN